jgi:hypothetical protein
MASKRVELKNTDGFVKLNNGGLVDTNAFVLQIIKGQSYIGTVDKDSQPPVERDCFQIEGEFSYTGDDDAYIKAVNAELVFIIDKV